MTKLLMVLLTMSAMLGCTKETVRVSDNSDRISELERRANLNDELDALQSQLIGANADAIATEVSSRQQADNLLTGLIQQEQAARIAGDLEQADDLAQAIHNQYLVNFIVNGQISFLLSKINSNTNKINQLKSRVNNLEDDVESLEDAIALLNQDMLDLDLRTTALENAQTSLQAQINSQGVQVFKCNASSSTERVLNINGKFYAVMNRVTKSNVNVVTGSSSQTYVTPDMCETWSGDLELPNSGGNCTPMSGPFKSTKVLGQTIVVPSYTTASVSVVTSVKIALDILVDGSYATTDNGPACNFSISNGGTTSTNLVQVQ